MENWSCGEMKADFALTVGMAYFNDTRSVWEPLIEPVVKESTTAPVKYIPWSITANIAQRKPVTVMFLSLDARYDDLFDDLAVQFSLDCEDAGNVKSWSLCTAIIGYDVIQNRFNRFEEDPLEDFRHIE